MPKQSKRGKSSDTRPARKRYWHQQHLVRNKVRAMMRQRVYVRLSDGSIQLGIIPPTSEDDLNTYYKPVTEARYKTIQEARKAWLAARKRNRDQIA